MRWIERLDARQRALGAIGLVAALVLTIGVVVATSGGSADTVASDDAPVPSSTTSSTQIVVSTTTSRRPTTTLPAVPVVSAVPVSTSTAVSTSTPTSSTTTTTIDPATLLPTLREGDSGPEVVLLQRMLINATGARISPDGTYGSETVVAIRNFQKLFDLPETGEADHETRQLLRFVDGGRSGALPSWPVPSLGNGGADGCQVTVVGDSLMAGAQAVHVTALGKIGCASAVDGVGGRSLAYGWQCRELQPNGSRPLLMYPEPLPGNDTCAPSGLTLLALWAEANALGDIVVVALGTNDAGLYSTTKWESHWNEALRLTGGRPVVFVSTKARAGTSRVGQQDAYAAALRTWCAGQPRCHLADWALTMSANDASIYYDDVHLRRLGTQARADFIAAAVRALFDGVPLPNPRPVPTPTSTIPATTTTVPATTTTVAGTTTTTRPATTTTTSTTQPTTTTTTSTTTVPVTQATTTTVPTSSTVASTVTSTVDG